jgi:DNA segregation ATPase FtsK/SpoIIIE, S-DNA-T family
MVNRKPKRSRKPKKKHSKKTSTNKSSNKFAIQPFLGGLLLFLTIFLVTALFSYSAEDPSFYQASDGLIQNLGGTPGAYVAGFLIQNFGYSAGWAIIYCGIQSFFLLVKQFSNPFSWSQIISICIIAIVILILTGMLPEFYQQNSYLQDGPGGIIGKITANFFVGFFGLWGSLILFIAVGLPAILVLFRLSIIEYIEKFDNQ